MLWGRVALRTEVASTSTQKHAVQVSVRLENGAGIAPAADLLADR